ncbi:DUF1385 domain-containing protein [bacterium]|nr:DUF1385 domain-containing protein [bacterium]MBU1984225.1 DUF1385 domain-containing protein [bacterium]
MGGQAVIEGVMMRSPHRVAVAVRKPNGEIAVRTFPYTPLAKRKKWIGQPVIRGAVGLVESLKIGIGALNWSAEQAAPEEEAAKPKSKAKDRLTLAGTMLLATVIALALFLYFPLWVGRTAVGSHGSELSAAGQIGLNIVAGAVRVLILLGYMWAISFWKDIHRVFQYHGSEHKTIFAFEKGDELSADRVLKHTRFHPRCGTSFLLIVALSAIIFFAIVDSIVTAVWGDYPSVLARFAVHLPLVPLVAGISYEILKFSAKHTENRLVKVAIQPGLWLQKITTQEPDPAMCEVAVTALRTALRNGESPESADAQPVPEKDQVLQHPTE